MSDTTNTSPFKLVVFSIFFGFTAIGVTMFALYQAAGTSNELGNVLVWGTIPENLMNSFTTEYSDINNNIGAINYVYKDPATFDESLIEALASGYGPDLVLLSNEQIIRNRDRMYVIPYEQYDARTFKNTYALAAQSLMLPEGIIGMPIAVDPLILYWNRSILTSNKYPLPPTQWGELFKMSQDITRRTESNNIEIATIALGETTNVLHAKDIFIAMLTQAGGSIVQQLPTGEQEATLTKRNATGTLPAQDALRFFTEFSNPTKSTYSWNKSMPIDRDAFIQGELAMYIGYASELPLILKQNPNLNFDIAMLPHIPGGNGENLTTYARVYALAIPRVSSDPESAKAILDIITTESASKILSEKINLPSPHNSLLAIEPSDALKTTFRNSAIMSRSWLDPNPVGTYNIIAKMIDSVTSGEKRMSQAIQRAQKELQVLLDN
jgi:ABC-type glycerol-3-phosphate transport system substrate-binding protein